MSKAFFSVVLGFAAVAVGFHALVVQSSDEVVAAGVMLLAAFIVMMMARPNQQPERATAGTLMAVIVIGLVMYSCAATPETRDAVVQNRQACETFAGVRQIVQPDKPLMWCEVDAEVKP